MELDQDAFSEVFMIPLSSAISSGLTWSNIARNRGYELRLTCEVVSTLRRPGFFSSSFLAETQEGQWRCGWADSGDFRSATGATVGTVASRAKRGHLSAAAGTTTSDSEAGETG